MPLKQPVMVILTIKEVKFSYLTYKHTERNKEHPVRWVFYHQKLMIYVMHPQSFF